uniref:Pleurocidin-like peptide WF3 n=1 Tax=Pseudopleuronectes americanus TaxID=8265 RepID=PLE3_PSEAM
MKFTATFLVLSLVVLMAEPGECFLGALIKGAIHGGRFIHGMIQNHHGYDEQQELNKRAVDE